MIFGSQTLPIMLALCLMLSATYHAQNYAAGPYTDLLHVLKLNLCWHNQREYTHAYMAMAT